MNAMCSSLIDPRGTFADGIEFTAGAHVMPAGSRLVLARNAGAFQMRYGIAPGGLYAQKLGNSGDHLILKTSAGAIVRDFSYGVIAPWPSEPDGFGPSLVLRAPMTNPDHKIAANWRASSSISPGGGDSGAGYAAWKTSNGVTSDTEDTDRDGINAFLEYATGGAVNANSQAFLPTISRSGANAILTIRRNLVADDVAYSIEASGNLQSWNSVTADPVARSINGGVETLQYAFPLAAGTERFFRVRFLTQ